VPLRHKLRTKKRIEMNEVATIAIVCYYLEKFRVAKDFKIGEVALVLGGA
jgi:hypothetical protein